MTALWLRDKALDAHPRFRPYMAPTGGFWREPWHPDGALAGVFPKRPDVDPVFVWKEDGPFLERTAP